MRRREFVTLIGSAAATWPLTAHGQQARVPQIGLIQPSSRLPENYCSASNISILMSARKMRSASIPAVTLQPDGTKT
jgi:hypothetical protein